MARVKRGLPKSPRHKQIVVRKLFSSECNVDLSESFELRNKSLKGNKVPQHIRNKIQEFYERDDISRQVPGRKDAVTVWENGKKFKKQAQHLVYSLREVFELFKLENPTDIVGKSPQPEDKIFYPQSKLIRKLKPPIPVNSRGFYKFVSLNKIFILYL